MTHYDILSRYTDGLRDGKFDQDLTDGARLDVLRLLRMALRVLDNFGATPAHDLAQMMRDPQEPAAINERVSDILYGCLAPDIDYSGHDYRPAARGGVKPCPRCGTTTDDHA